MLRNILTAFLLFMVGGGAFNALRAGVLDIACIFLFLTAVIIYQEVRRRRKLKATQS